MTLQDQIDAVVAAHPFGRASAVKRGRRKEWPYVPVIDHGRQAVGVHMTRTEQLPKKAYATRDEAISYAQRVIDARREDMRSRLAMPHQRTWRKQLGLPENI